MAVIKLNGNDYEVGARFTIGELKRMTEVVDASDNVVERSRQLVAIALARKHPDVKLDDDFETDIAELNAAAATVIDVAGFVMLENRRRQRRPPRVRSHLRRPRHPRRLQFPGHRCDVPRGL